MRCCWTPNAPSLRLEPRLLDVPDGRPRGAPWYQRWSMRGLRPASSHAYHTGLGTSRPAPPCGPPWLERWPCTPPFLVLFNIAPSVALSSSPSLASPKSLSRASWPRGRRWASTPSSTPRPVSSCRGIRRLSGWGQKNFQLEERHSPTAWNAMFHYVPPVNSTALLCHPRMSQW